MRKHYQCCFGLLLSFGLLLNLNVFAQSIDEYLREFPYLCSDASDREALPGHILRLGNLGMTRYGLSFFFPDQRNTENLQMVGILENAGIIGEPNRQPFFRMTTPVGSFVVAHVFVGDPEREPVVTCVSRPILVSSYDPVYYGTTFSWLDQGRLGYWLRYRKFNRWNWKRYWRRDFFDLGERFRKSDRFRSRRFWRDDDRKRLRDVDDDRRRRFRDRDDSDRGKRFRDREDVDRGKRFRDRDDVDRGKKFRDRDDSDRGKRVRRDSGEGRLTQRPGSDLEERGRGVGAPTERGKNIRDRKTRPQPSGVGEVAQQPAFKGDRQKNLGQKQKRRSSRESNQMQQQD